MENIPEDVQWVFALKILYHTFYCGIELHKKIEDIIDKNPKYFPQEHIYKNIPKSVKDEFESEKHKLYMRLNPFYMDIKPGEGLLGYMNRKDEECKNEYKKSLIDTLKDITGRDLEYKKQLKLLHNKYFKSYGYIFKEP